MTAAEKVVAIQRHTNITWKELAKRLDYSSPQTFTDIRSGRHGISTKLSNKILEVFPEIRKEWLLLGEGPMLRSEVEDVAVNDINASAANTGGASSRVFSQVFPGAEKIVRNIDRSMVAYPVGSYIVLKPIKDMANLVPGQDYYIETEDFALVRRVQKGKDAEHISLYATNAEKYPDGRLAYEPFEILVSSVKSVSGVMGYMLSSATIATEI